MLARLSRLTRKMLPLAALLSTTALAEENRTLTFEERVRAQEAMERVYYSHQLEARRSFEAAVTPEVLERKVRTYLRQSAALEKLWETPVTAEALRAELRRIARNTQFPGRLQQIYDALGNDPVLAHECFARPALVDRLARSFFAADDGIHAEPRRKVEALRTEILLGVRDVRAEEPGRSVMLRPNAVTGAPSHRHPAETAPTPMAGDGSGETLPDGPGTPGPVQHDRDTFHFQVLLSERAEGTEVATYRFPKVSWDTWWRTVERSLGDPEDLDPSSFTELPRPGEARPRAQKSTAEAGAFCLQEDRWETPAGLTSPEPRSEFTTVWTGSVMIVWGGFIGEETYYSFAPQSSGYRYDPITDSWSPTSRAGAPSPRSLHSAVWAGDSMIVWGGVADNQTYSWDLPLDTGGRYDPITDTWQPTSVVGAPTPRSRAAAVWTGDEMLVWGSEQGENTGGRYDPSSDTWTRMTTVNAPAARVFYTPVWSGEEMIIWGGQAATFGVNLGTGGRYDPDADEWLPISPINAPASREAHSAVWTDHGMIVWGGFTSSGLTSTGGIYDPSSDTWTSMTTLDAPEARYWHATLWTGTEMILWGGGAREFFLDRLLDEGGRYDPVADRWSPISIDDVPSGRFQPGAVWTEELALFWGGRDCPVIRHCGPYSCCQLSAVGTGGRYDPGADRWTPTASGPPGRKGQSAVWTGTEMILWGGNSGSVLRSGDRYDPLADTWKPTPTQGAPSGGKAVWAGDEMVVWIGPPYGSRLNGGSRYDPVAETWTAMSVVNAPEIRSGYSMVWTGEEVLVWGGRFGFTYLNSGGLYDPGADTWRPMSTTGAPTGRRDFRSVWTGEEMLVWGGRGYTSDCQCFVGELANGRRYDAESDTWSPMSEVDAPVAGTVSSPAVWTGDEMLIWSSAVDWRGRYDPVADAWSAFPDAGAPTSSWLAGWTGNLALVWSGSGGRFDPAAETWYPLSEEAAPTARSGYSSVWTGDRLILWGGSNRGTLFNSGATYEPGEVSDEDFDGDGLSPCDGDCDDGDPDVSPEAPEACDGLDNDCDGEVDEGWDADGDSVADCFDNCPLLFNPDQADYDDNGAGDVCDPPPGFDDDTDRLDPVFGPDPFPVLDRFDISEVSTLSSWCDFQCSGGSAACCGTESGSGAEPALIFTMGLLEGPDAEVMKTEYEVFLDFGEEGLAGALEEPGLDPGNPWKGTSDLRPRVAPGKRNGEGTPASRRSLFKGVRGIELLSEIDPVAGIIRFVIPVSSLQDAATPKQAAASGFDRYPLEDAAILLWFRARMKSDEDDAPNAQPELVDRAPNSGDNLAPTTAAEALSFVVPAPAR